MKKQKMWLKKEKKKENEAQYEHLFSMTFEFATDACFLFYCFVKIVFLKILLISST